MALGAGIQQLTFEFSESLKTDPGTKQKRIVRRRIKVVILHPHLDFFENNEPSEILAMWVSSGDNRPLPELISRYQRLFEKQARSQAFKLYLNANPNRKMDPEWKRQMEQEAVNELVAHAIKMLQSGAYSIQSGYTFGSWLQQVLFRRSLDIVRYERRRLMSRIDDSAYLIEDPSDVHDVVHQSLLAERLDALRPLEKSLIKAVTNKQLGEFRQRRGLSKRQTDEMLEIIRNKLRAFLSSMPVQVPATRPKLTFEEVTKVLDSMNVRVNTAILGVRGYYRDSIGVPGFNDRGVYDDAIFLVNRQGRKLKSFNANVDPSVKRRRIASLKPGVYKYETGFHGITRPDPYPALRQSGPVTVVRDDIGEDTGFFAINIHKGSVNSTSSEGCQTLPPDQWTEFINYTYDFLGVERGTKGARAKTPVTYVLVTRDQLEKAIGRVL